MLMFIANYLFLDVGGIQNTNKSVFKHRDNYVSHKNSTHPEVR